MDASSGFRLFKVQNGIVISESGQQDADDFAADFQGLRHFADRVGGALELGGSVYAALHEPAFSFMFRLPNGAGETSGTMIARNVSNNELIASIRPANA